MLTSREFTLWCLRLNISRQTRELIELIRNSEPSRIVRDAGRSVRGQYPSRKMGRTIQFESHRCELPFIQLMDQPSNDVLEIWDQPLSIPIKYETRGGRRIRVMHTPDFFLCRREYAEFIECKTESELLKLTESNPNRFCRGEDGEWRSPPGEQYANQFGLRYTVQSAANINHTYIRNIQFLDDYCRFDSLKINSNAQRFIVSTVKEHKVINLSDLFSIVLPSQQARVTADDVYCLIVNGDLYVDLYTAPLVQPEKVKVYENSAAAEPLPPVSSPLLIPKAASFDVTEGARVIWDDKVLEITNVNSDRIWLHGGKKPVYFTHESFNEYIAEGLITPLQSESETDPYSMGLQILDNAEIHVRAEAERRFEAIKPYLHKGKSLIGIGKERTLRRYISKYREAEELYGIGLIGLLPNWAKRGHKGKRFPDAVYEIMDALIKNQYETLVQKDIWELWGKVLIECESQGIPDSQQPSYETFRKRVHARPKGEQTLKRKGKRAAYKHTTFTYWLNVDTPPHGDRPFEVAHADHTELDIELVCPITGENFGRPWASFLVDAFSRRLLAIVIMFDEPSYRSCMMLFRECVRRHGRLPQTIVVDGGADFNSNYFRRFAATFQLTLKVRPSAQPRHGAVCERLFGTANSNLIHALMGNTQLMKNVRQVTKSNNAKGQAVWSLGEFTEWFTAWGYEFYDQHPHWTLKQSPRETFARSLEITGKRRRMLTYNETFRILTMPTTRKGTAKNVVDKGLKINSIYYWCDRLRDSEIEGKQLPIRYDPYDVSKAYVYIRRQWIECRSEYHIMFAQCTERQLRIASAEMRNRNKMLSRRRSLSAKQLATFISSLEEVQSGLAARRLRLQKAKDREVRPLLRFTNTGSAEPSNTVATDEQYSVASSTGGTESINSSFDWDSFMLDDLQLLKELR